MLIEKDEFFFNSVTDLLDLFSWSTQIDNGDIDAVQNILKRFHNHPSLIKVKQLVNKQANFSFRPVSVHTMKEVIERLPSNKATVCEIPIKILKESRFTI